MSVSTDTQGRAYGLPEARPDPGLVRVGPGTPGGELMRRYWQPIARSSDATDLPKEIKRFGETLILFRNQKGEPGLLYPRCIHRGTSLLFGRVEDDGIRCCYHGWKFATDGKCLDQPCEPKGGIAKQNFRQPWYPVAERWGAIWAYMGPPDRQPLLPEYSNFQDLADDEEIILWRDDSGALGPGVMNYNWFQYYDNVTDSYHVQVLHSTHSGDQFKQSRASRKIDKVDFSFTPQGNSVLADNNMIIDEGEEYVYKFGFQAIMPNAMALPPFFGGGYSRDITYLVPQDDESFLVFLFIRQKKNAPKFDPGMVGGFGPDMKLWNQLTQEEHQRYPTDYEAQYGQGVITKHSEEHLVTSDRGIVMQRKLFKENCEKVARGEDPAGVAFRPEDAMIEILSRCRSENRDGTELQYVNDFPPGLVAPA